MYYHQERTGRRLYSLFEKMDNGKFRRISKLAFTKERAIRLFQDSLLLPYFEAGHGAMELKPVGCEVIFKANWETTESPNGKISFRRL